MGKTYWEEMYDINEDLIRRVEAGEKFGVKYDKEETLRVLTARRQNYISRIRREKFKTCKHFLINNTSASSSDWTNVACIKCGLDQATLTRGLLCGTTSLSEDEKDMCEAFFEVHKHYDPTYFIKGDLHLSIEMDLEEARKIYNELAKENPDATEDELCKLFMETVNKKQSKFDREVLEAEYPEPIITEETIADIKSHPELYVGAPVKTATGRIYTTEAFEKRSEELLSKELPLGSNKGVSRKKSKKNKTKESN